MQTLIVIGLIGLSTLCAASSRSPTPSLPTRQCRRATPTTTAWSQWTTTSSTKSMSTTSSTSTTTTTSALPPVYYLKATHVDSYPDDYTPEEEAQFQQSLGKLAKNELSPGRSTPYDFLYLSEATALTASVYTLNNDGWLIDANTGKIATSLLGWRSQFVYWDLPQYVDPDSDEQVPAVCSITADGTLSCNVDGMNQFSVCFAGQPEKDYAKLYLTKNPRGQGEICRGVQIQAVEAPRAAVTATPPTYTPKPKSSSTTSSIAPTIS